MSFRIIIGNIIALIASLLMVYSGVIKQKKKILYVQIIQIGMLTISNIVLGGFVGAIVNAFNCLRNILYYNNKLSFLWKMIISIVSVVLSIKFNNLGVIGFLPLIAGLSYLWLMNIKDVVKFKVLIIFTLILWGLYDFVIKSYSSMIFDLLTITTTSYSIYKLRKEK